MDFGFSQEQGDIRTLARQILADYSTPERLLAFDNYAGERFDRELWARFAEAGLLGVAAPTQYGGMDFGFVELALLAEEAGRSLAALPLLPHLVGGVLALCCFGNEEQKQRLLPGAIGDQLLLSAALEEPEVDDDARPSFSARAEGAAYRVSGSCAAVPFARSAQRILIAAQCEDGVLVLLLDPQSDGVSCVDMKTSSYEPQALLQLDDVLVAGCDVLAGPQDGAQVLASLRRHMSVALCAHQVGVTDSMMRQTASYTSERKQFGVPIATFQAVGHRAANCFIDVECLRLVTYQAASLLAQGGSAAVECDIAKIWAGDVGHRVSYAAQHLHGGAGVDRGNALWRYCQWARHNEMTLGSSALHLARLGARCASGEALVD